MQGKSVYIRTKVVGPFLGPCVSGSYVCKATGEYHKNLKGIQAKKNKGCMHDCNDGNTGRKHRNSERCTKGKPHVIGARVIVFHIPVG
jgi:hypothetical protein